MTKTKDEEWASNGWEAVHIERTTSGRDTVSVVDKLTVPGGWLVRYRRRNHTGFEHVCFVSDPARVCADPYDFNDGGPDVPCRGQENFPYVAPIDGCEVEVKRSNCEYPAGSHRGVYAADGPDAGERLRKKMLDVLADDGYVLARDDNEDTNQ